MCILSYSMIIIQFLFFFTPGECHTRQHCSRGICLSRHVHMSGSQIQVRYLFIKENAIRGSIAAGVFASVVMSICLVHRFRFHTFFYQGECTLSICKHFKEPRNQFPAWRAGTTTLDVPAREAIHWLVESIPGLPKRLQIRAQFSGKRDKWVCDINFSQTFMCSVCTVSNVRLHHAL